MRREGENNWATLTDLEEFWSAPCVLNCPLCAGRLHLPASIKGEVIKCRACCGEFILDRGVAKTSSPVLERRKRERAAAMFRESEPLLTPSGQGSHTGSIDRALPGLILITVVVGALILFGRSAALASIGLSVLLGLWGAYLRYR